MQLINLMPHPITLRAADGTDTTISNSGRATAACVQGHAGEGPGVPVPVYEASQYGSISGLPEKPEIETLYIVSDVVGAAAVYSRQQSPLDYPVVLNQLVMPGTGPQDGAVRDKQGRVVAVTRLVRV